MATVTTNYDNIYSQESIEIDEVTRAITDEGRTALRPPPPSYQQIDNLRGSSDGGGASATLVHIAVPTTRGEPPSYDEAIDPDAPPPSYDSLFGRMREARKKSHGFLDFAKNVFILLIGTIGCTMILGITLVIPITMVVFGSMYLHECPQGEYIPVYLLVGGLFGVFKQLLYLSTRVRSREDQAAERVRQSPMHQLINCFMLGWFIMGSYWIYKIFEPNYDTRKASYCNKSLYLFAFWLVTSIYISLTLVTVSLCFISFVSIYFNRIS